MHEALVSCNSVMTRCKHTINFCTPKTPFLIKKSISCCILKLKFIPSCVCVCVGTCTCTSVNLFNTFTATLHNWRLLSVMTRVPLSLMRHGNQVQRLFDLISLHNPKVYQHLASYSVLHIENYVFLSCN